MLQASFELGGASLGDPALVAGAIVLAFFLCHYNAERRHRREFLRWCERNQPRPLAETLADTPILGDHQWTHPSGLYGVGTAARGRGEGADSARRFLRKHTRGYALALLSVSLLLVLRMLLEPVLQGRLPYMFFSAAVLLTAAVSGIWETLLALILGFLAAEWFVVEPRSSFMISGTHGWLGAFLYFLIGLGIVWFKRSEAAAELQALASDIAYVDRLKELDRERALRAVLGRVVEDCPDAVFGLSREGKIVTWNTAAEKLFGFSGPEAIGQPISLIVPPAQRPNADQLLSTLGRGETALPWQSTFNRKDGSRLEVSMTASAARDAAGKVVGVAVVARSQAKTS